MTTELDTPHPHRAADTFRDYLDDEIGRAFRKRRTGRRIRGAAIVMLSLGLGTSAGIASAQIRDGAQRDSLLAAAQADAMLVSARLALAQAHLVEEHRLYAVGARSPESVLGAEGEVRDMEAQLGRAGLNIEEIKQAARAPRDELNAPLVNGKDFVKSRIQLQVMSAQQQLQAAERARDETMRRVRVGMVSRVAGAEADLAALRKQRDLIALVDKLSLRREFLDKNTPVEQLMRRHEQTELKQDINIASRSLDLGRERMNELEKDRSAGATSDLDVLRAQVEVKEREVEIQRLVARLRELQRPM